MSNAPLPFRWTGEVMEPLTRFMRLADQRFVIGEVYRLEVHEERSRRSHDHYFARVEDLWQSLPDTLAMDFPTPDALRYHALCMTGFRRERKFAAESKEEARKLAAWLRDGESNYAIISVKENVVIEWRPRSQSYRSMPRGEFQESKTKTLAWMEDLIGVESEAA